MKAAPKGKKAAKARRSERRLWGSVVDRPHSLSRISGWTSLSGPAPQSQFYMAGGVRRRGPADTVGARPDGLKLAPLMVIRLFVVFTTALKIVGAVAPQAEAARHMDATTNDVIRKCLSIGIDQQRASAARLG